MKSRRSKVKKQTASVVANLRPMQARGPNLKKRNTCFFLEKAIDSKAFGGEGEGGKKKKLYIPILKAVKASSLGISYQREGLYFSGSSKYRGL